MESVFVGIEIGGTKIQVVTGDGKASIVRRQRFTADPAVGAEGIRGQIAGALANVAGRQKIAAIGVGFGGPFDRETGRACCSHQVAGWDDFPLHTWLSEQAAGAPVAIDNDGNTAALGEAIDLTKVEVPTYIQAGKDDHIAPVTSVWKLTEHFPGPPRFVLAGSGHIAGVVNPPAAGKYQYWINEDESVASLDAFRKGATEHPGSWWPDWIEWIRSHDDKEVPARGKRKPGSGKTDTVIEPAPGRYVKTR